MRTSAVAALIVALSTGTVFADTPPGTKPPEIKSAPPVGSGGVDFLPEVQLLYRVAACGGGGPVPPALWQRDPAQEARYTKVVDTHCKALAPYIEKFRAEYFAKARTWFLEHEPKNLPTTVVYPFGGGDLISALVPFPDATEITTLSLELAGDPRNILGLSPADLEKNLHAFRVEIGALILVGSNSSLNLSAAQRNGLPAQLSSHLLGLSTAGYELVGARYFTLDDAGAIHYLEKSEIEADTKHGKSLRGNWKSPAFAQSFANVELQFTKPGDATLRTHRHIAWNLGNDYLKDHPGALNHLAAKGKVTMMTKGASYLLWLSDFATIRKYLLEHLVWMLSDSTGIPPTYAKPAGMVQETFGTFAGPIVVQVDGRKEDLDSRALWKGSKAMPFRFGYLDKDGHKHVMFTHPK